METTRASPLDNYSKNNNTAVKRILREFKDLQKEPSDQYSARPLDDNLFEWHFNIRGPSDTAFAGGVYHGRILLPFEYPFKPPAIMLLTPNGRFEVNKKICLSMSSYHPESWQPCWSIRTVMVALRAFMPSKGEGAVAALDYTAEERVRLARRSTRWTCPTCKHLTHDTLLSAGAVQLSAQAKEQEEAANQICFTAPPSSPKTKAATAPETPPTAPPSSTTTSSTTTTTSNPASGSTAAPSPAAAPPTNEPTDPSTDAQGFPPAIPAPTTPASPAHARTNRSAPSVPPVTAASPADRATAAAAPSHAPAQVQPPKPWDVMDMALVMLAGLVVTAIATIVARILHAKIQ